ncbi:GNAT family N-acetyltransferase [Candidatus Woesearchaeota archaeon]|nr:GNAT family N-acetyltransferase [Candidatus Woesearchaeota archaeon]
MEISKSCDNEDYVEYEVTHDDGSRGSADLRIMELDRNHHMRLLLDGGLPSGSKIAEIFFYPHSSTTQHRQGIGSQVLDTILNDVQKRRIRAVYCEVTNTIAEGFFRKMGFDRGYDSHYYKIIS